MSFNKSGMAKGVDKRRKRPKTHENSSLVESKKNKKITVLKYNNDSTYSAKENSSFSLQNEININLARLQKVAKRYYQACEMIEELGTELKDLKIKYDGQKHQIRFENQQRRTKISTYENKIMITNSKLDTVKGRCQEVQERVDNIRRARFYENQVNLKNRQHLGVNIEEVGDTDYLISHHKVNATRGLEDFHSLLEKTKWDKIHQTKFLAGIREGYEGDMPNRKPESTLKGITYFAPLGKYELLSRRILRKRIRDLNLKNFKKRNLIIQYTNNMERYDKAMNTIKLQESNDDIVSIFKTLKKSTDKNVEMYSKLYEMKNQIDDLNYKIESNRGDILKMMEDVSFAKRGNEINQKLEKKKENAMNNIEYSLLHSIEEHQLEINEARFRIAEFYKGFIGKSVSMGLEEPTFVQNLHFEAVPIQKYLGFMEVVMNRTCNYENEKKERYYEKLLEIKRQMYEKEKLENGSKEMSSFDPDKSKKQSDIVILEKIEKLGQKRITKTPPKIVKTNPKFQKGYSIDFSNLRNKRKKKNNFEEEKKINYRTSVNTSGKSRWRTRAQSSYRKSQRANMKKSLHHILGIQPNRFNSKSVQILYSKEDLNQENNRMLDLKKFKARNKDMFKNLNNQGIMLEKINSLQFSKEGLSTNENSLVDGKTIIRLKTGQESPL